MPDLLPPKLIDDIDRAGYHPQLLVDLVAFHLGEDHLRDHLVHVTNYFAGSDFTRDLTILLLTGSRLLVLHANEAEANVEPDLRGALIVSADYVPLSQITVTRITHAVVNPTRYTRGSMGHEVTLSIAWTGSRSMHIAPVSCADPECDADHGYEGASHTEDLNLRISSHVLGAGILADAHHFVKSLTAQVSTALTP